ncbi:MAG: flagellar hook capping FlgD N-terminal domain-containing protein [Terracidiphilus sp.]|jgi:flagellar basal-body rod modification protein FlgD
MAAAAAGIFSQHLAAGQALTSKSASPMANATTGTDGTDSSTDASGDSSTISANDFLTLLVTEMQNQDPTANTDPNEYINQLVQVNSLEQLIDINQNLTTALGDPGSGGTTGGAAGAVPAATPVAASASPAAASAAQVRASAQHKGVGMAAAQNAASSLASSGHTPSGLTSSGLTSAGTTVTTTAASKHAPGNLSVPGALPAAQQVAHALNGKSHSRSIAGSQPGANGRSFTRRP